MSKEDFLKSSVKERILEGLNINYLGYVSNKEELINENNQTLKFLNEKSNTDEVIDLLIEHARLELNNTGKIAGIKEILEIINVTKARNFVVDFYKSKNNDEAN